MYRCLSVVALIAAASRVTAAQETVLIPSDREANAQVAQIVASAEASGLPTNPIVGKVRYGVTVRRSKPSDLVAAARTVAERLEVARASLEPNPSRLEIEAGASALEWATPDALKAVRRASGTRPVVVPLGVLTQLITSNVPVKRATEIVTELIKRGATTPQLVALGNDVQQDVEAGRPANAAVADRARGLTAVLAAEPGLGGDKLTAAPADVSNGGFLSAGQPKSGPPKPPKRP